MTKLLLSMIRVEVEESLLNRLFTMKDALLRTEKDGN
jgi:hypothetical protein